MLVIYSPGGGSWVFAMRDECLVSGSDLLDGGVGGCTRYVKVRKGVDFQNGAGKIGKCWKLSELEKRVLFCIQFVIECLYIYIIYTPNLGSNIAVFNQEREQGGFGGSSEGAPREHRGSMGEHRGAPEEH